MLPMCLIGQGKELLITPNILTGILIGTAHRALVSGLRMQGSVLVRLWQHKYC